MSDSPETKQSLRNIETLLEIMARLRDPDHGCPWDVEQDFHTIAPYTIEEAYEVADAIDRESMDDLEDELGDLLFQVVFHARMAEERDAFDFGDVVAAVCHKMIRRHPHVFADAKVADAQAQTQAWEAQKARERAESPDPSALSGIGSGLPEWLRAHKLQKRAARVGFDWPDADPVVAKVEEELQELEQARESGDSSRIEAEFGDLLFAMINLGRHLEIDVSRALRGSNRRFEQRFRTMERLAEEGGASMDDLSLEAQDALWNEAKRRPG